MTVTGKHIRQISSWRLKPVALLISLIAVVPLVALGQWRPVSDYNIMLRVKEPIPEDQPSDKGFIVQPDGRISIVVRFSFPVNTSTVVAGRSIFLNFPGDHNPAFGLQWSDQNKTLTILTKQTRNILFSPTPGSYFTLELRGDTFNRLNPSTNPLMIIMSEGGAALDGNNDRKPGGNFFMRFKATL